MTDREKVVKKLEELLEQSRFNDSVGWNPDCDTETLEDALALLKAQTRIIEQFEREREQQMWNMPPMGGFHDE